MGTFLAWASKIYITKGKNGKERKGRISIRREDAGAGSLILTSLRSSFVGMLHSIDLSSRPGRRRALSMRSGRLGDDVSRERLFFFKIPEILRRSYLVAART
jgi:hypothetical protein